MFFRQTIHGLAGGALVLFCAAIALADTGLAADIVPAQAKYYPVKAPPPVAPPIRYWVSADYLGWWTKRATTPPLLTLGNAADPIPAALGQPGTQLLFGGSGVGKDFLSGFRLTAGAAVSSDLALEASGFLLANNSASFAAQSNGAGLPIVGRPVIFAGAESSFIDSFPGLFAGGTSIDFRSSFYGVEANAMKRMSPAAGSGGIEAIVGLRYLHLSDDLQINDNVVGVGPGSGLTFLGNPADPPSSLSDFDKFSTGNDFYGAQIGARGKLSYQNWELSGAAKVAFGVTHETVDIQGATTLSTPGAASLTAPGGLLAETTNIGHYASDRFTVVPELELKAAYQILPGLFAHVGYDFMYWSDVARAGDQINRTINPNLPPGSPAFGTPGGGALPAFSFNHTDFWVQGITTGLEYRF